MKLAVAKPPRRQQPVVGEGWFPCIKTRIHMVKHMINQSRVYIAGWWQLKYLLFSPLFFGEDESILTSIFFRWGWFNHQLDETHGEDHRFFYKSN